MIPDLTRNERQVFSAIYARPWVRLTDLPPLTHLSRSAVECQVMRLEDLGLIVSSLSRVRRRDRTGSLYPQRVCVAAPWVMS